MNGTTYLKEPVACSECERLEFARLVRQGFEGSDEGLEGRITDSRCLAFHYAPNATLAAIAGLKAPDARYRDDVFKQAEAPVSPADYELELGWVFVVPAHRGSRMGEGLCRQLLARVPNSCVFATTRPNNGVMIKILSALGFTRVGKPYRRRNEQLVLYLRSSPRS
ncbi:MAG: hypothetical protein JSU87_02455 [Gemmatimonadota bacterium]|nr:MAG: hypothetical protein JSU87_02455 [Gemmatimonadota bacterium]